MALWQQNQLADRADTTKNPQFQNIQNMIYAGRMDPETALGYTIGRFLSSRYNRWAENQAEEKAKEYQTLQNDIQNNTLTTPDGNVLDRNLMYGNQFNNPGIQGGTSAGTTAIDSSMANAAGIGASNQLLGNGLGNGTAQGTAQQMADSAVQQVAQPAVDAANAVGKNVEDSTGALSTAGGLLTGLNGAQSLVNLGKGNANLGDLFNIYRMATFFDPAATGENGTAASEESTERKKGPQYVAGSNIPGMIEAGNIDIANRPVVRNPDGSISTVRSITVEADGKYVVLPTIDPEGNNLTPDQAWDRFVRTHENLGVFDSQQAADNYAQSLHTQQEQMYVPNDAASNAGEDLSFLGRGVDIRDLAGTAMEGLQTEPTPLDYQGRQLANELIAYKQAYNIAKSQNNEQGMQQAINGANAIRQQAGQMGIDLSPYDAGRTLAQAQEAFMSDTNRGIRNILQRDRTSDEYYNDVYNHLRENGIPRDLAQQVAARQAGQYQAQRVTRLNDALVQYGIDPSNYTLNDYGTMILMRMQQEDPNAASGLARMYGLPADLAREVMQMNVANNNARNSLNNAMTTNEQRYRLNRQQAQDEAQLKAQLAAYQNELDQQNIAYRYNVAIQYGLPAEQAREFALTGKISSGKKGGTNSGNGRSQSSSTADARAIIEMANKWDEDHPGQEWANPYRQDAANAEQAIHNAYDNTFSSYLDENGEITDARTAYSAGTWLLENNAKNNYPANQQEMEAVIRKQIPRFADALIQQWRNDGTLAKYSA